MMCHLGHHGLAPLRVAATRGGPAVHPAVTICCPPCRDGGSWTVVAIKGLDLDELAYRLRQKGLTYSAIADRFGISITGAWRRVIRHERRLRREAEQAPRSRRRSE